MSCNRLQLLPMATSSLRSLSNLRVSHNQLGSDGDTWQALSSLTGLTKLLLDHNRWA